MADNCSKDFAVRSSAAACLHMLIPLGHGTEDGLGMCDHNSAASVNEFMDINFELAFIDVYR